MKNTDILKMKTTKFKGSDERMILTAMVVNSRVLGKIHSHLSTENPDPFRSKWCNLIAKWCLGFYSKYNRAPRRAILTLFKRYAEKANDEDSIELIDSFISSLDSDYKRAAKELNTDFVIDLAARHFNKVRMEMLQHSIESALEANDVEKANESITAFKPFRIATDDIVNVFEDVEAVKEAIVDSESDILIRFPGALGQFYGKHFERDGFIAFLAGEKKGKSFFLIDIAWRAAVKNRRKTLYYSVGDMSKRQMMRRFIVRAARRPIDRGVLEIPTGIRRASKDKAETISKEKCFKERISLKEAKQAMIDEMQIKTAHKTSLLKMRCTANSTTQVAHIDQDIEELTRNGWIPDVVVIDYADILAPEAGAGRMEFRHQIDATWRALRRLSQKHHILVVTATQADADSYGAKLLHRTNFSEDKRKLSHVTGMIGLNQTEDEKEQGIFRLNWILLREDVYYESKCVTVAGSLAISNPAMVSCW